MSSPYEGGNFSSSSSPGYTSDSLGSNYSYKSSYPQSNTRRDYHDLMDSSCEAPSKDCRFPNHKNDDGNDDCDENISLKTRAFLAGLIAFVYIALFVWLAGRYGPIWAGIFGSIPGTLLAAIFFEKQERVPSLVFALILGGVAALAAAAVFYWLTVSTERLDKYTIFMVAAIVWIVVIGVLFALFKDKIESNIH